MIPKVHATVINNRTPTSSFSTGVHSLSDTLDVFAHVPLGDVGNNDGGCL